MTHTYFVTVDGQPINLIEYILRLASIANVACLHLHHYDSAMYQLAFDIDTRHMHADAIGEKGFQELILGDEERKQGQSGYCYFPLFATD